MKPNDTGPDDADVGQHDHIVQLSQQKRELEGLLKNLQNLSERGKHERFGGGRELSLSITNMQQSIFWLGEAIREI